jgi:hypothetical protein
MSAPDLVFYEISREAVERQKHDHVIATFDISKMTPTAITEMQGKILFCFGGYDKHEDEIYAIPAVRKWIRSWHKQWPYWLYFCTLQNDFLKILYLARLDSLSMTKNRNGKMCEVRLNPHELTQLVLNDFKAMNTLAVQAGIPIHAIAMIQDQVIAYFGLNMKGRS